LVSVVISYSHKDEKYKDELVTHLASLRRSGNITDWHDRKLTAGSEFDTALQERFESDAVILLLVSSDYISSEYCWQTELVIAMKRHNAGQARVIPIILRPCDWRIDPISKLLAAPRDGMPVSSWPDRDAAWLDVVQKIRAAINEISRLMDTKAVAASSAETATTVIAQPGPTVMPAIQHDPKKLATVMVEWSGAPLPMEYQAKISIDGNEGKTGSLKQGFSLEFQVYPGPHKLTINTLKPLVGGVQALEKISDVLGRHLRLHIGKPGRYRVVLGYNMLGRGFKISQIIGPD
jgi:TIR domain